MSPLAVILPAAGSSTRFGRNKLLEPLAGESVILHAIRTFAAHPDVGIIVIATNDASLMQIIRSAKIDRIAFCPGGKTRADSVRSAVSAVPSEYEFVAVHDAARPLI